MDTNVDDCGCIEQAVQSMQAAEREQLFMKAYEAICRQYGYRFTATTHVQPSADVSASDNTIVIQLPTRPMLDVVPVAGWHLPEYKDEEEAS